MSFGHLATLLMFSSLLILAELFHDKYDNFQLQQALACVGKGNGTLKAT